MKRKLGIALLIIATVLAGTPEALSQFHTVGLALRQWAGKNLGGSFLVYAADTGERALPDRYDYHMVAPATHKNGGEVMARLSLSEAISGHAASMCPFALPQRNEVRAPKVAPHSKHTLPAPSARIEAQTARLRAEREAQRAQARELARVLRETFKALGGEFNNAGFDAPAREAELAAKLKALRPKQGVETIKLRRVVPVKVAFLNEADVPTTAAAPASCPIATTSSAPVYTYTYSLDADRDRR
jgi:hypothetical protein